MRWINNFCLPAYHSPQISRSLFAIVNKFCIVRIITCNFVTIVGLTNNERCFIHSLRVEKKHWGFKKYKKMF